MRLRRHSILVVTLGVALAACGQGSSTPEPGDSGPALGQTALRYRLDARFAPIFFCDPDYYPIGTPGGESENADVWWRSSDRGGEEISAIIEHLEITGEPDDAEILAAYREHKRLLTIEFATSDSVTRFELRSGVETDADRISGTITDRGTIAIGSTEPADTACPICLAAGTRIDAPEGAVAVQELRVGTPIWTTDMAGDRIRGHVVRLVTRRQDTPVLLLTLTLHDGRSVTAAAAHPTADGRTLGTLRRGDAFDGSVIASITAVVAPSQATFDLLPSGPTGTYRANGVLLASTLR